MISHCSAKNYCGWSAFTAANWNSDWFYLQYICFGCFAGLGSLRNFLISCFLFTFNFSAAALLTNGNFKIDLFEEMIIGLDQQILYFDFSQILLLLLLLLPLLHNLILHLSQSSLTSFTLFSGNDLFFSLLSGWSSQCFIDAFHYFPLELSWLYHFLLVHIWFLKTKLC